MKPRWGYAGKYLYCNLTEKSYVEEELEEELARKYIGGWGVGCRILWERIKPGVDPLGPFNVFGIGTGPFALSGVFGTCRFHTMGKSPLTGYWGGANCGGSFAYALKGSGYDMAFFEGRAEGPVYVYISDEKVEIRDASHLWGLDAVETEKLLKEECGEDAKVICIGPAGEKLSKISAVINDRGRAAARSGLGAVMGAKNLKAVVCKGSRRPPLYDEFAVAKLVAEMRKKMKEAPSIMFTHLSISGTCGAVVPHLATHDTPIKNWKGNNVEDFPQEKWSKIGWDVIQKYQRKRYGCTGCPVACGGWVEVEGKWVVKDGHKPEYETIAAFGPLCLVDDVEAIIYANELCNRYGFDTISAGATIAFAIECFQEGILTRKDTDGLELRWGDADVIIQLLHKMAKREGIGDLLADGAKWAAERIGRGAMECAMHVGGELVPMHDPRYAAGWGATYVSDATPARHTRGGTQFFEKGQGIHMEGALFKELQVPERIDKDDPRRGYWHAILAARQYLVETSSICLFVADSIYFPFVDLFNAITGWGSSTDDLIRTGKRIATLLHAFNLREGFRPLDFTLPPRICGRPPLQVGALKDVVVDAEKLKRQYYMEMGFDPETGEISSETVRELELEDVLGAK
ncbi:MAG: aldehyde ferredoxin oxidoreductase family protein [Candidatus Bathyarchaeia archaeon]